MNVIFGVPKVCSQRQSNVTANDVLSSPVTTPVLSSIDSLFLPLVDINSIERGDMLHWATVDFTKIIFPKPAPSA